MLLRERKQNDKGIQIQFKIIPLVYQHGHSLPSTAWAQCLWDLNLSLPFKEISFILVCFSFLIDTQWQHQEPPQRLIVRINLNEHIYYIYTIYLLFIYYYYLFITIKFIYLLLLYFIFHTKKSKQTLQAERTMWNTGLKGFYLLVISANLCRKWFP